MKHGLSDINHHVLFYHAIVFCRTINKNLTFIRADMKMCFATLISLPRIGDSTMSTKYMGKIDGNTCAFDGLAGTTIDNFDGDHWPFRLSLNPGRRYFGRFFRMVNHNAFG